MYVPLVGREVADESILVAGGVATSSLAVRLLVVTLIGCLVGRGKEARPAFFIKKRQKTFTPVLA